MFFIGVFGTGEDEKELRVFHNVICPNCGRYTQARLVMTYSYFHIFFIPVIKYRKRWLVRPACSCSVYEADALYAEELKNTEQLDFGRLTLLGSRRICRNCLREIGTDFEFCPYCGKKL